VEQSKSIVKQINYEQAKQAIKHWTTDRQINLLLAAVVHVNRRNKNG
jgi:hypothetical protein